MSAGGAARCRRRVPLLCLMLASLTLLGCVRGCPSARPPIHLNPNMDYQPKYQPQEASRFFYDGAAMRMPPPGTVARGAPWPHDPFYTGRDENGEFVASRPGPTDEMLARGEQRYAIYCVPCHDKRGNGRGILFERGNVPTPSFHEERIVQLADGEMFDVITNGKGLMPGYGYPISAPDRWAIISHVRQLQQQQAAVAALSRRGAR